MPAASLLLVAAALIAQARPAALPKGPETVVTKGVKAGTKLPIPTYRMTFVEGPDLLIRTYTREAGHWAFRDINGRPGDVPVEDVQIIAELSAEELGEALRTYPRGGPKLTDFSGGRTEPRAGVRTAARTSARTSARGQAPAEVDAPTVADATEEEAATPIAYPAAVPAPYVPTGAGTTATGIPLHVGPRGGVFHYSKSGKKVYQKRK